MRLQFIGKNATRNLKRKQAQYRRRGIATSHEVYRVGKRKVNVLKVWD